MKLIVLSDLHMLAAGSMIIGIDPGERLSAALADIGRHHADARRLVILGDLTHWGGAEQYRRLADLLAHAPLDVTLLLGNHDRRDAFLDVFPSAPVDRFGFVQCTIDDGDFRLVCLDTLYGPPYEHDDIHAGHLCARRLAWLDDALAGAGKRGVLLFMHHPPHATGFAGMDGIRLREEAAFFDVLERHGNVRHIFAGHIHRTISGSVRGVPFSIFKSPVHQQPMTLDSMDTSLSVPEPGAYGIVLASAHSVLVHSEDFTLAPTSTAAVA